MSRKSLLTALGIVLMLSVPLADAWGRGRGGGGGGRGGLSGGGFSGGASRSVGGAARSPGGMSSGIAGRSPSGFSSSAMRRPGSVASSRGPGGVGGVGQIGGSFGGPGAARANLGANSGAGRAGTRSASGTGAMGGQARDRFAAPSGGQLNSFLGLPSDQGLHSLSSGTRASSHSTPSQLPSGGNFDVNYGTAEGARGGQAGAVTVTGPQGNTAGRVAGIGPQGGVAAVGGVQGAGGGSVARGAAVGPGGQVVAGRGAVGPGGYGRAGVVTSGPAGVAAGFTRSTPAGRYTVAAGVRGNYNHWGVYGRGWYAQYPGAWLAAGWAANAMWNAATWGSASSYCGYSEEPPVYYDYGNSVVYEDGDVYINGDSAGTAEQYYDQAAELAKTGAEAQSPSDGDWLPLGVFAFTRAETPSSDITIQLAISKEGLIRGNYTDAATKQNQVVQGSVDKQTQRVAFTVGDNTTDIIETGLYNLTKDEAPCLIHFGNERTEQWLLVRLQAPESSDN